MAPTDNPDRPDIDRAETTRSDADRSDADRSDADRSDLLRLMTLMTGDEKHTARFTSTLGALWTLYDRVVYIRLSEEENKHPLLEGTSLTAVAPTLSERPRRNVSFGVPIKENRHYGTREEHRSAHRLDAAGALIYEAIYWNGFRWAAI